MNKVYPSIVSKCRCANYPYLQLRAKLNCEGDQVKGLLKALIAATYCSAARHHGAQLRWKGQLGLTQPTLSIFPVGGNRSTRRKPTTFGRALTNSFHITIISHSQREFEPTLAGLLLKSDTAIQRYSDTRNWNWNRSRNRS